MCVTPKPLSSLKAWLSLPHYLGKGPSLGGEPCLSLCLSTRWCHWEGCLPFSLLLQVFEHLLCARFWARCWSTRWTSPGSPGDPALEEEMDSGPRARAGPLPMFVNKTLLTHSYTHSSSIVWGCFPATMGELSSWDRDCMAHNAENIYPESLRLRGFVPTMVSCGGISTATLEMHTALRWGCSTCSTCRTPQSGG